MTVRYSIESWGLVAPDRLGWNVVVSPVILTEDEARSERERQRAGDRRGQLLRIVKHTTEVIE